MATFEERKADYLKGFGIIGRGLEESDITLANLEYEGPAQGVDFSATDKNRVTRHFAQVFFHAGEQCEVSAADMMDGARELFGELFDDDPSPERHPFLYALLQGGVFRPVWRARALHGTLALSIEKAWENREQLSPKTRGPIRNSVHDVLDLLDRGVLRVANRYGASWEVNDWVKKAVLLSFRLSGNDFVEGFPISWDKVPLKCEHWDSDAFREAGFRMVPGSIVRRSAYVAPSVVLMPSFVNIGAYVDEGTMVDTWATIGSCAQIGKNCHISGGAGIGGVLEPLQANPVIIEDECFIGARSEVAEGVIVQRRAVLSMGVFIGKNTPIVNRTKGNEVTRGVVPEGAVVMMGVHPENGLLCPQIVKYRDERTDAATALNELLRA